ncbi:MAG: ubiE [Candidatus Saccharibacteria bacterium]|nr:ubiE [Candidatus Saccharibacteria bacterium]
MWNMSKESIVEAYNQQADAYAGFAEDGFAWKYLESPAYDHYLSDFYRPDVRILDIGCGNGLVARHFIEHGVLPQNITGVDPSSGQINKAQQLTPGARFVQASAESFEVEPASYDLIITNTMLHHLDNEQMEAMLERIYAALKPDGAYFFLEVDQDGYPESFEPTKMRRWLNIATPWGTEVPFFNRDPHDLFDALDRHGFNMSTGWPIKKIAPEGLLADPSEYVRYSGRPSRMAARFSKVPELLKVCRYYDVHTPDLAESREEARKTALVDAYFAAWKQQSVTSISEIFTDDAIYDEKPGILPPLVGLEQIQNYWRQNPLSQENIRIDHHIIGHTPYDNAVWASFKARFLAKSNPDAINGIIRFNTDPQDRKITRLTEWFEHV